MFQRTGGAYPAGAPIREPDPGTRVALHYNKARHKGPGVFVAENKPPAKGLGMGTVIGIAGAARSGKDTAGTFLIKRAGATRVAFADALKREICETFGITPEFIAANKEQIRPLMVEWGRMRRLVQPDYWIRAAEKEVLVAAEKGPVVITDVRYENEARWVIEELGGRVIYTTRPGYPPANAEERESLGALREWLRKSADNRFDYAENAAGVPEFHALLTLLTDRVLPPGRR